jgi:hypothetical protein
MSSKNESFSLGDVLFIIVVSALVFAFTGDPSIADAVRKSILAWASGGGFCQ